MKKTIKLIGIIALALALATTACDGNGGGNGNGNGGGGGGTTSSWPPSSVREQYNIGGLDQPPNTTVKFYYIDIGNQLNIQFNLVSIDATQTYLNNWFTSNGWTVSPFQNQSWYTVWMKSNKSATYIYDDEQGFAVLTVQKP